MTTKLIKTEIMCCNDCPYTKLLYSEDGSIGVRACTFSPDVKITDIYSDKKSMGFTTCIPEDCKLDSFEAPIVADTIESLCLGDIVEFIGERDCQYKYLGERDGIYLFSPLSRCSRYVSSRNLGNSRGILEDAIGFISSIPEFKIVKSTPKNNCDNG